MGDGSTTSRLEPWLRWSDDADKVEVLRPAQFVAGAWVEVELKITLSRRKIAAGERLGVGVPFGFPPPRCEDPRAEAYTTVQGPVGTALSVSPMEGREHFVWVTVESGVLNPGDRLMVRWGDRSAGSPGVRVPRQAFAELLVPCFRAADENALLTSSPRVTVKAGPAIGLRAHLPGAARPGEAVRLRVVAQDAYGNCPPVRRRVCVLNPLPEGRGH